VRTLAVRSTEIEVMYRDIPPVLLSVVEPVVRDHGLEVVDARVQQGKGRSHVQIVLDTPEGDGRVKVDVCAEVSREVSHGLDAADFLPGAYLLEVSSPGVDRTLGRVIDFERVVGREVSVETREPLAGQHRFRGTLEAFEDGEARVHTEAGDFRIPFDRIRRAQAFYPFDSLAKGKR
jgi:ribosome maturation factor RimP